MFRLLNPVNLCYLNAVAYSFWMIVRSVGPLLRLPQALRENAAGSFNARQLFAYHLLGWRRPEQQHDVAELIQYLLPKLAASSVAGGVELRQLQPADLYRQLDSPLTQCVVLPAMPRHTADLQALINFWHTQDIMHALTAAHPRLLLQFPRFR